MKIYNISDSFFSPKLVLCFHISGSCYQGHLIVTPSKHLIGKKLEQPVSMTMTLTLEHTHTHKLNL